MTDPTQPSLGRQAEHHPSFLPPPAAVPPPIPAFPAPPPGPPQAPPPPPGRRMPIGPIVAAVVGAVLLAGVGWYVWGLLGPGVVSPPPATPTVASTQPMPTPAAAQTVTGGDIGRDVAFTSQDGAGVVRVTSAVWAADGEMSPGNGRSYLIVDLEFTATQGEVPVGSLYVDALDAEGRAHLFAFGPEIDQPLRSRQLPAGEAHNGQVGFELPRGQVELRILDGALRPVATLQIPAR